MFLGRLWGLGGKKRNPAREQRGPPGTSVFHHQRHKEQVTKGGVRSTGSPKSACLFLCPFSFLYPLLRDASRAEGGGSARLGCTLQSAARAERPFGEQAGPPSQASDEYFIAWMEPCPRSSLPPLPAPLSCGLAPPAQPPTPSCSQVRKISHNIYQESVGTSQVLCRADRAELIRTNKVTTDFAVGIADKGLSGELQGASGQPGRAMQMQGSSALRGAPGSRWGPSGQSGAHPGRGAQGDSGHGGRAEVWTQLSAPEQPPWGWGWQGGGGRGELQQRGAPCAGHRGHRRWSLIQKTRSPAPGNCQGHQGFQERHAWDPNAVNGSTRALEPNRRGRESQCRWPLGVEPLRKLLHGHKPQFSHLYNRCPRRDRTTCEDSMGYCPPGHRAKPGPEGGSRKVSCHCPIAGFTGTFVKRRPVSQWYVVQVSATFLSNQIETVLDVGPASPRATTELSCRSSPGARAAARSQSPLAPRNSAPAR